MKNIYLTILFTISKILLPVCSLAGLIVVLSFTVFKTNLKVINFDGSSSMKEPIEKIFKGFNGFKNIDINVQASGSHVGFENIINNKTDFGLVSFDIDENFDDKKKKQAENKKIKIITLAQDAVVLLYKSPTGCNDDLVVSKENVKQIYSLFTGYSSGTKESNLKNLMNSSNDACSANITPFSRVGGSKKSGTANAFVYSNPLFLTLRKEIENNQNNQDQTWLNNILSSKYGDDFKVKKTIETNRISYEDFDKSGETGSMIYLSGSFVFSNWERIQKSGYKIAKFKKSDESTISTLSKKSILNEITSSNYPWVRNMNLIYSLETLDETRKKIIEYIVKNTHKLSELNLSPVKYIEKEEEKIGKYMYIDELFKISSCNRWGYKKQCS